MRVPGYVQVMFDGPGEGGGGGAPSAPSGGGSAAPSAPVSPSPGPAPSAAPAASPSGSPAAPSGAPATPASVDATPGTPAGAPANLGDDMFAGLEGGFEDDFEGLSADPLVAPATVTPTVAPAPAAPAQAAPVDPNAPPAVAGAQPPPGQPQAQPIPSAGEPGRLAESMRANEGAIIEQLASRTFALSEADNQALETNAAAFIPQVMARVYFASQVNMLKQMERIIPALTGRLNKVNSANKANEDKFYQRWPDIKPDQHGETILRLARAYRQMNPNVGLDQLIEELGPIALMTLKIQPGAAPNGQGTHVPVQGGPARRVGTPPPSPFRPAAAGGGGIPTGQPAADPWGGLAGNYTEED